MTKEVGGNIGAAARRAGGGTGRTTRGSSAGTAGKGKYQGFKKVKQGRKGP